nr:bifunctional phosphopantothenoylcysteine decarboxylase/phosphopantothenate--cysteine ligase CoaBC [Massiliimalia massiliensis]
MDNQKTVVLGISGGIAAYKIADLASRLTKEGFDVHVVMTKNAAEFITPLTFETLTGNKCITDTFARDFEWDVKHVSLAKRADAALLAPATANLVAKLANGLADDMLTTTVLAMKCPVLVSPSMNTAMYEHPATQKNLKTLRELGYRVIEPESGVLACKDVGKGRLPKTEVLYMELMRQIACEKDLSGKKILVTAGPTQEALDPVRFLSNHSTGKMGYEIAKAAHLRGAAVTLVSGPVGIEPPYGVKTVPVVSAGEMFEAVKRYAPQMDWIIKAAAVADFTPAKQAPEKIKKQGKASSEIALVSTADILQYLGEHKRGGQLLCGFSMETEQVLEHSREKLLRKHADLIVANSLKEEGAGFGGETNIVTLISENTERPLPKMSKEKVAHALLDELKSMEQ